LPEGIEEDPKKMSVFPLSSIQKAVSSLSPNHIREQSERPLQVALYAPSPEAYRSMEEFFVAGMHDRRRRDSLEVLTRGPAPQDALKYDLAIYHESVLAPRRAMVFHQQAPELVVKRILVKYPELAIPLSRYFAPFRKEYTGAMIRKVSRENALFSLATALPDIIPSFIELPWAVAEFASDTAVLTANQIRLAFVLAAASDRPVGYSEQKSEIASLIGGAFGWRALARQVISKIPFGGGLIPKAAIAYAGTRVVGLTLERYYHLGYMYTREERESLYQEALQHGRKVAHQILRTLRPDLLKEEERKASGAETANA
jgi:hypothetical protein